MKKLSILAAVLAAGTMCIAGCDMGGAKFTETPIPETRNIVVQEEIVDTTPEPAPDKDCGRDGNCNHGKMPFKKPGFKFKAPQNKHGKKGRNKFRRPHKRPEPGPEKPETPTEPIENENN